MAKLTVDQYIAIRGNQYNRAVASYAIVLGGMIGSVALSLAFGPAAGLPGKLLLLVAAAGIALYACLAIPAIWAEAGGLRREKPDGIAGTAYEAAIDGHNYPLFSMSAVSAAVIFVLVTIWLLFA